MRIGEILQLYRKQHRIGVRTLAKTLNLSHGTISRIERGYDCDAAIMLKLINWLFGK